MELGQGAAAANLGVLLQEQGKTDKALAAYHQGLELGYGGAAFNLGLLLARHQRLEEAAESFRTGFETLGASSELRFTPRCCRLFAPTSGRRRTRG